MLHRPTTIAAFLALVAWILPQSASATPIIYGITISGGTPECELLRPLGQPCPATLTGSITVDSSKTTFDEQFISFSLPMVDGFTYTDADLWPYGDRGEFTFDENGFLTAFQFNGFIRQPVNSFEYQFYMTLYLDEYGGRYRFGHRADPIIYNGCNGCVAVAVSEPDATPLLATGGVMALVFGRRRRVAGASR